MAQRSRAAATELRKRALLDAALDCFAENGYAATTIDEVRLRAGASIGSLYHHYGGKEQLASALYVDLLSRYEQGHLSALENAGGPENTSDPENASETERGVRSVVEHHLGWAEANPEGARFLLGNSELETTLARAGDLPPRNRRFYRTVQDWVRPRVASGELRKLSSDLYYALWIGPSQELIRQWLAGRARTTPMDAVATLADAAWVNLGTSV